MAQDKTYQPKVYIKQDGEGLYDENVTATTSTSINNYGYHTITGSKVVTLDPPVLGACKQVRFASTLARYLKAGGGAYFNASPHDVIKVQCGTSKDSAIGATVKLRGASTALWYIFGITAPMSTLSSGPAGASVLLTSAT